MTQPIQNFDVKGGPHLGRDHLPLLRAALKTAGLDGFIIPHEDEYNNEYLPANAERLAWATGFTGSAGAAIVLTGKAAVFVDGRYTEQVKAQVDAKLFEYVDLMEPGPAGWLKAHAPKGARIGYDPRLHAPDALARLKDGAKAAGAELIALDDNPIDAAWRDRPPAPRAAVVPHPEMFSGEDHGAKRRRIARELEAQGADACVITSPASIAWLFNLRGGDVACTPLPLAAALLDSDARATLFIEESKLTAAARAHLGNEVAVRPESEFGDALKAMSGKRVLADPASASVWVFQQLEAGGASVVRQSDPAALPRACKNAVEIEGARQAHIRDGEALVRFLHWLDTEAQSGHEDEITAALKLEEFRKALPELKDLSFETISAAGPNGAFPHYRVNTASALKLAPGSLYLVDSGGQYPDGTTDVTRTVPIGEPTAEMRRHFTLVLKGHIALSVIRFPEGTTGSALDALARAPLWMAGLDYDHGTGHGVGSYLGVHEGPQRIAKAPNAVALRPGMIVSNEPGYYEIGAYGIRIENLQVVTPPAPVEGGNRAMLGFESLTMAPIHRGLIDTTLLSPSEIAWLDAYHAEVRKRVLPRLDGEAATWLIKATEPLYGATP
ncbi:aminopeptidase P family protein [Alkalicaulis satelles]|uniref:Aminopeptidase P family protein n=1 Tax=Alkalicaulis satelles TaxID=2609175 RepID=A0A5M6Z8L1_9PROT|nr:aminopeptidase P family protein [Alkalicaulis satelles]KAA5800976.1 aminopeptidase P family protein [Alkalicaulis satelles]